MDAHTNLAYSTVATAPSPATTGTSLVVAAGEGTRFPDPATVGAYNVVVCAVDELPIPTNAEIVRVTAKSTDTLTIVREQESTTARTVVVGDAIFAAVTAKTLSDIEQQFIRYTYDDSSTADSDPGAGKLKFDNADPTSATFIYIDDVDADGNTQRNWFQSIGTVSNFAWLTVRSFNNPDIYIVYVVTGAPTLASGYVKIPVMQLTDQGALPTTVNDIGVEMTISSVLFAPISLDSDPAAIFAVQAGQLWHATDTDRWFGRNAANTGLDGAEPAVCEADLRFRNNDNDYARRSSRVWCSRSRPATTTASSSGSSTGLLRRRPGSK